MAPSRALALSMALLATSCLCCIDPRPESVSFSDLRVEEITARRAVLRFTTQPETSCEAEFGVGELSRRATDPNMDPDNPFAVDHEVPLEDLVAGSEYSYRARTTTRSGATFFSEMGVFTTLPEAASDAGSTRVNVALLDAGARVAAVSSNFGGARNDEPWGANAALDGQMSTEWSSSSDGNDAFLTVDLGTERHLMGFAFRSRHMTDGSSIIQRVQLVVDENEVLGPFETPDPAVRYEFEFERTIAASTVRVEAVRTTGGNTGAREIELLEATSE